MIRRLARQSPVAIFLAAIEPLSLGCAQAPTSISAARCDQTAVQPVAVIELPGSPFQAIPSADGCHVFVSLVGPVEPGDPRRPPQPAAPNGGVAVVSRVGVEPSVTSVVTLEGSPYGMVLTHDGRLLIVASDDRVAFIDSVALTANSPNAILGYLNDAPMAGRVYANVTPDDRWLFLSDESARTISVVDLRKARASGFNASAVVGQIPVGRAPIALTFSEDHRFLYSTSQVAPSAYGWPRVCSPPASEIARQGPNCRRRDSDCGCGTSHARSRQRGDRDSSRRMQSGSAGDISEG